MKTKLCSKCGVSKALTTQFFKPRADHSSGFRSECRECSNAASMACKKANPEAVVVGNHAWYEANKEASAAKAKAWAQANPGKNAARSKEWYAANKAYHAATCKKWAQANLAKRAAHSRAWQKANPGKNAELKKEWAQANPGKNAARSKEWAQANPEAVRAASRAWAKANPGKNAARCRAWAQANPEKCVAYSQKRRAAKLNAVPKWADDAKTLAVYARAAKKTADTGIPHHVDHRVPLQNSRVCGLHWHANLRVIPAKENLSKGNRVWENMR